MKLCVALLLLSLAFPTAVQASEQGDADTCNLSRLDLKDAINELGGCPTTDEKCPPAIQDLVDGVYMDCAGTTDSSVVPSGIQFDGPFRLGSLEVKALAETCFCSSGSTLAPGLIMGAVAAVAQFMMNT